MGWFAEHRALAAGSVTGLAVLGTVRGRVRVPASLQLFCWHVHTALTLSQQAFVLSAPAAQLASWGMSAGYQ